MEPQIVVVGHTDVPRLLPMDECVEIMEETLTALSEGRAIQPLRSSMWLPDKVGALVTMPGYLEPVDVAGLKVITFFAGNRGTNLDTHQGGVMLFDAHNGSLLALIDATEITGIRTAAVSGVATRALARKDVETLAILGSGTQAQTHLEAMLVVRQFRTIRVWSRTFENARTFSKRESERRGVGIEAVESAEEAVRNADVICTTTSSMEPVLLGDWLSAGAHINAVGSSIPFARELDTDAVVRSKLYVDRLESALNEAGDFLFPKKEGVIDEGHIRGELGDLLRGKLAGRSADDDITLFKSLGLAVEDLASAHHIYRRALETGAGQRIFLGGVRREQA